jgi:hypothetical protein
MNLDPVLLSNIIAAAELEAFPVNTLTTEMLERLGELDWHRNDAEWLAHHIPLAEGAKEKIDQFWNAEEARPEARRLEAMYASIANVRVDSLTPKERDDLEQERDFVGQEDYSYTKARYYRLRHFSFRLALSHAVKADDLLSALTFEDLGRIEELRHKAGDTKWLAAGTMIDWMAVSNPALGTKASGMPCTLTLDLPRCLYE